MKDNKVLIKEIIEKLTSDTSSTFTQKVFNIAAERGLGDSIVHECIEQLLDDKFVMMPVQGVLKRT